MPPSPSDQKNTHFNYSSRISSPPVQCNRNQRYNYFSPLLIFLTMLLAAKSSTALLSHHQTPLFSRKMSTTVSSFLFRQSSKYHFFGARASRFPACDQDLRRAVAQQTLPVATSSTRSSSRLFSSSTINYQNLNISDTPLGSEEGSLLLDGLDVYTVPASEDGHPLTVYGIGDDISEPTSEDHILLMLHGRTWSSVPVYHLLGGPSNADKGLESRSLMEALNNNKIRVYSMDFRGFGGTPPDASASVEPNRCVEDVESVLAWLAERHGCKTPEKISLMGWSQGALVAQLTAQRHKPLFSRLILYGSIFDPLVRYPRDPLYLRNPPNHTANNNTFDAAIEDFTIEGTIPPKAATYFAEAALLADPVKAHWKNLYQFNNCDPAMVHVPTLVVSSKMQKISKENNADDFC